MKIHLHCFDYGRGVQPELEKYCASVQYYKRQGYRLFSTRPHIVDSRHNEELFQNLLKDDHPILMEGIHCTALLGDPRFADRACFVRLHNVEFRYYADLQKSATSPLKKAYYGRESRLLKKYEQHIAGKATFLAVTEKDAALYHAIFNCENASYIPLFLPPWKVNIQTGMGGYCLYQGDLSIDANIRVVEWLVKKVFADTDVSLKIAGKKPSRSLQRICSGYKNISLIAGPSQSTMQNLIAKAHINIVPSFSDTGIKLKLINALFNGRHCIANENTVAGTGLAHLCHVANTADHLKDLASQLYYQPFREDEVQARRTVLEHHFDNEANARKLVGLIWK